MNNKFYILILCLFASWSYAAPNPFTWQVTGVSGEPLKNVLQRLKVEQDLDPDNPQALYQRAPEDIRKALQPFGYFKAEVSASLSGNRAHYKVKLGPQMHIQRVIFQISGEGNHLPRLKKLAADFPIKPGQPLLTKSYDAVKKRLLNIANAAGYLDAQFTKNQILIDLESYTSQIILHFNTGPLYYFGSINFQNNPLNTEFLKRYAPFKSGEPYSKKKLQTFQNALNQSQYFDQVFAQPLTENLNNQYVPIQVNLAPRKSQQYRFGLGYGTDTNFRGSIGVDFPYLTKSGHRFAGLLRVSNIQTHLQAAYTIPGNNPLTEQYAIQAHILRTFYPSGNTTVEKLAFAKTNKFNDWEQILSLASQKEKYFLNSLGYPQTVHLLLPSATWQYLKADNLIYPSYGNRFRISLQGASRDLLSDINFLQAKIEHKYIQRFYTDSRIILKGELGYTSVQQPDTKLPLSLSFFAGGSQSVRSYGYQALGPGRYLAFGSVEYQHRIKGNWNAAIFYDIGNAFNHFANGNSKLQQAAGVGIVWVSPLGPINVSIAKGFTKPVQPLRLQFSMGAEL